MQILPLLFPHRMCSTIALIFHQRYFQLLLLLAYRKWFVSLISRRRYWLCSLTEDKLDPPDVLNHCLVSPRKMCLSKCCSCLPQNMCSSTGPVSLDLSNYWPCFLKEDVFVQMLLLISPRRCAELLVAFHKKMC